MISWAHRPVGLALVNKRKKYRDIIRTANRITLPTLRRVNSNLWHGTHIPHRSRSLIPGAGSLPCQILLKHCFHFRISSVALLGWSSMCLDYPPILASFFPAVELPSCALSTVSNRVTCYLWSSSILSLNCSLFLPKLEVFLRALFPICYSLSLEKLLKKMKTVRPSLV